jgi:alkylhydroperoxidase family enzyme
MSWLTGSETTREQLLELRPPLAKAHNQLVESIWDSGVPAPLLELCRLRMAQILRCAPALAQRYDAPRLAGLRELKIEKLSQWPTDLLFDETERACIEFAELFVIDQHAITDAQTESVRRLLGDAGIVAFTTALGVWENQHRFDNALAVATSTTPNTSTPFTTSTSSATSTPSKKG